VERPVADLAIWPSAGAHIVLQLDGFLFFGTAHAFAAEKVKAELAAILRGPKAVVSITSPGQPTYSALHNPRPDIATDAQSRAVT